MQVTLWKGQAKNCREYHMMTTYNAILLSNHHLKYSGYSNYKNAANIFYDYAVLHKLKLPEQAQLHN